MTSSFQPNTLPDISQYNYAKTEPDLTESINDNIDRLTQDRKNFYDQKIEQHKQYLKQKEKQLDSLINLIPTGFKIVQYGKELKEAEDTYGLIGFNSKQLKQAEKDRQNTQKLLEENDQATEDLLKSNEGLKIFQEAVTVGGKDSLDSISEIKEYRNHIKHILPSVLKNQVIEYNGEDRTLDSSQTEEEFEGIFRNIMGFYPKFLYDQGANPNLVRGYLSKEIYDLYQNLKVEWLQKSAKILEEKSYETRQQHLLDAVTLEGGEGLLRHIKTYHPFHGEYSEGWKEAFSMLYDTVGQEDGLTIHEIEELLDFSTKWRGSGDKEITLEQHRKKDAAPLRNRIKEIQTQAMEAKIAWQETQVNAWVSSKFSGIPYNELTEQKVREIYNEFVNVFAPSIGWDRPVPDKLKKILTQSEDTEENRFELLKMKHNNGEIVTDEDAYGITGLDYKEEIDNMVNAGKRRLTDDELKNHNSRIEGLVADWIKEEYKGQKPEDIEGYNERKEVLTQRAQSAYIRARRSLLKNRPTIEDEVLYTEAIEDIKPKFSDWWTGKSDMPAIDYERGSLDFKDKISNNKILINSNVPLNDIERNVLMENAKLLDLGLPLDLNFYHGTKIKYNGKTLTSYEIATSRLASTGFIKEGKPIPERVEVSDNLQELLLKNPSAANLARVISESEEKEWAIKMLNRPEIQSISDLYGILIWQNTEQHKFGSADMSWMTPGLIDEDLNIEYQEVTGDFNIYSNPQNMPPALGTLQVEQKLTKPEFDMATLGQPVDVQESFEQTGLYKAGVGTRDLVMSALTDDEGNFNAFGRVLKRFFTGEGAEDVEAWIRTAPIGQIIDMLDGILDPSVLEQIEESTQ